MSRVKICGLSRLADADAVNAALPDYAGFVFAESRRRTDAETAARIRERLDPRILTVGVFAGQDPAMVAALFRRGVISLAQLHGDEDADYVRQLRALGCGPVVRAVGIGAAVPSLPEDADFLLFDGPKGGAGRVFDWGLLADYSGPPYFLAGGLVAGNVSGALRQLNPYAVDVSSGVETDGVKDAGKIMEFVSIVRRTAV